MKLKPRLKGVNNVGDRIKVYDAPSPNKPNKGQKDGSCNRTACQVPLKGRPQFWMPNLSVENGRHYYCAGCERQFSEWDERMVRSGQQKPNDYGLDHRGYRCRPDEDNEVLVDDRA